MKKFFTWAFWLALLGSIVYFYATSPQMREYCKMVKKRMLELFEQMGCCHQEKESEEETVE